MRLNRAALDFIGPGADATLVTLNPDGSPHATLVWVAVQHTPDGDELVTAHLAEYRKVRNVRRDPRVAVTIVSAESPDEVMRHYLAVNGHARIAEGGAPELLATLAQTLAAPGAAFPPADAPAGYLTRIHIDTVGGFGPWAS